MREMAVNEERNWALAAYQLRGLRSLYKKGSTTRPKYAGMLDDYAHPNQKAYPGQRIMVIGIDNYAYLVPYVENEEELFLKTIIPSRKATQKYLGENNED